MARKNQVLSDSDDKSTQLPIMTASLRRHINRIKKAKRNAEKIFSKTNMDTAEASIEILWEMIFDYLCSNTNLSSADMTSMSSVVQRLASSRIQLANFEAKRVDLIADSEKSSELSLQVIEKIEEALKLL